jgi:branched-chain amino acid aminotransferase
MADEAFMTGTPFCILPVTSLHGVMIKEGKMGTVTRRLLERWGQDVDVDIIQQIRSFNREIEDSSGSATPYKFRK